MCFLRGDKSSQYVVVTQVAASMGVLIRVHKASTQNKTYVENAKDFNGSKKTRKSCHSDQIISQQFNSLSFRPGDVWGQGRQLWRQIDCAPVSQRSAKSQAAVALNFPWQRSLKLCRRPTVLGSMRLCGERRSRVARVACMRTAFSQSTILLGACAASRAINVACT